MEPKRKTSGTQRSALTTLGARIRLERQYKGWTQKDLATASGLGVDAIANLESDARAASEAECASVASALGITVVQLTRGKPGPIATRRGVG